MLQSFASIVFKRTYSTESPVEKPEIIEIKGDLVTFKDGSKFSAEVIIWCTGYVYSFPFLSKEIIQVESNPSRVHLFKHVFIPERPNIAFIGNVTNNTNVDIFF